MTNETHFYIDNITIEQATAITWLLVCVGASECKCHVVDKCVRCTSLEKSAAAFPNNYNIYCKAEQDRK